MESILITGYTGFIGTSLSENFKDEYLINGLDIKKNDLNISHFSWNKFEWIPNNISTIIHLAGKAHDLKNTSSDQEYFDINVGLTKTIFEHFLHSSASKFIFFSSVKAVADSVGDEVLTEDSVPSPKTAYGKSKLEAENYILSQSLPIGKKVYILRPCMIHGPGNKGNLNLLYKLEQKRIPWPLGSYENLRSFVSIDNVTYIVSELIKRDIPSGIYQIADDEPVSTNDLIRLIAQSKKRKVLILKIPKKIVNISAKIGDFFHFPLNTERLKKLTESYVVSNNKIKNALGINKMPVTAVDGLKKTFESFK